MKTFSVKLSPKEKIQLLGNMGTMLAAGIPILESVNSLLEESRSNTKKILTILKKDLEAGQHIHVSFAKFPRSFDKVTVNLVKAAEKAGTLETALKDIKGSIQKEMKFNDKVKSAMMYPIFVMFVFIGVMLMMLILVIPKISKVFTRLKADLPLPTKMLIAASNILINHWQASLLVAGAIIILIVLMLRYKREQFLSVIFSLPYVSGLIKKIDTTKFTRSMFLLLNSGLPIVTALELAQDVMRKKEMRKLVDNAKTMVIDGKRFSEGLRSKQKHISGMTVKLIEVGEKSGTLAESMEDISETLDYEVTQDLETATALLEPIMLVVVALMVGGMMMSIIGPIYGLIANVQIR